MMSHKSETTTYVHFAHANGFPFGSYQTVFDALPVDISVFGKEKFGHERDFPVTSNWTYIVDELLDFISQRNTAKDKTVLIGHSFGAVISYLAACTAPEKVAGLIMLDPPLVTGWRRYLIKLLKTTPLIDRVTPAALARSRNTHWPHSTDMVDYFSGKALFANMDKRCIQDYVKSTTHAEKSGIKLTFRHDVEADIFRNVADNLDKYAGKLQCPSLLVTGASSKVCMPAMRDLFIKQNELEHITTKGGHMFPLEYPEQTAQIIAKTLHRWRDNPSSVD